MEQVRARSFGAVADDYERYRPGYPRALVLAITARLPEVDGRRPRAIEIGAGTGKATRVFAATGIEVTAVEPDPQMLRVLRRTCAGLAVTTIQSTFEGLDPDARPAFDLVYAGAALHWTRPEDRWDRVAALLRPGGLVASFGGPNRLTDPDLVAVLDEVEERYGIEGAIAASGTLPTAGEMSWPGSELAADPRFTDLQQLYVPREIELDRRTWIAYLNTVSTYRVLDDDVRARVFADLQGLMPDRLRVNVDLAVHIARLRRGNDPPSVHGPGSGLP